MSAFQWELLQRYLHGTLSAEMALMYWLKADPDVEVLRDRLRIAFEHTQAGGDAGAAESVQTLRAAVEENLAGCRRIERMVRSGVDSDEPARTVEDGIAFCRTLFDWSVQQSSPASVALYSLGSERILDAATREVVDLLKDWQILGPQRALLEIGCGIGRFQKALAPHSASVTGIDVSPNMIAAARQRCEGIANVVLRECSGRDLSMFDDACFDAVLAIDSFPYLHQSGIELVERHFSEARRVLRPGGDLVILEFSYRNDIDADVADFRRLAVSCGFAVGIAGTQPFSLWDGAAFRCTAADARTEAA